MNKDSDHMSRGTPMEAFKALYTAHASATVDRLAMVEGRPATAPVTIRTLMVTPQMLVLEAVLGKGHVSARHRHDDHDTVCYLARGHMDVTIDGKTFTVRAGDSWQHPKGIWHSSVAHEESVQLEIKTPPIKTWQGA